MAKISSFDKIISFPFARAFCYFAIIMFQMSLLFFGFFLGLVCVHTTDQTEDQLRRIFTMEYFERSKIINVLRSGAKPPVDLELLDGDEDISIDVSYRKIRDLKDDFFSSELNQVHCDFENNFNMRFFPFMLKGEGSLNYSLGSTYPFRIILPLITDIKTVYSKGAKRTYLRLRKPTQPHEMSFEIIGQLPTINVEILKKAAIKKMHVLMFDQLVALNAKNKIDIISVADFCFEKRYYEENSCLEFKTNNTELKVTGLNLSNARSMVITYRSLTKSGTPTVYRIIFTNIKIRLNNEMLKNISYIDISGTLNSSLDEVKIITDTTKFGETVEPIIRNGIKFFIEQFIPKSSKSISADKDNINYFLGTDEVIALLVIAICVLLAHPLRDFLESACESLPPVRREQLIRRRREQLIRRRREQLIRRN